MGTPKNLQIRRKLKIIAAPFVTFRREPRSRWRHFWGPPCIADGNKATLRDRTGLSEPGPWAPVGHIGHPRRGRRGLKGGTVLVHLGRCPQTPAAVTRSRPGDSGTSPRPLPRGPATGRTLARLTAARCAPAGLRPRALPRPPFGSARPGPGSPRDRRAQQPALHSAAGTPARRPLHSQRPPPTATRPSAPAPPPAIPAPAPTCWSHSGHDLVAIFIFLARLADMLLSGGLLFSFSFNSLIYQKLMWAKIEGKGLIMYFSHIIIITCSSVIYRVSFLFPLTTDTKFFIYIKVCGWHCEVPLRSPSRNEELMPPAVGNSLSLGDCLS